MTLHLPGPRLHHRATWRSLIAAAATIATLTVAGTASAAVTPVAQLPFLSGGQVFARGVLNCTPNCEGVSYTISLQRYTGSWTTVRSRSGTELIDNTGHVTVETLTGYPCYSGNWYRSVLISGTTSIGSATTLC